MSLVWFISVQGELCAESVRTCSVVSLSQNNSTISQITLLTISSSFPSYYKKLKTRISSSCPQSLPASISPVFASVSICFISNPPSVHHALPSFFGLSRVFTILSNMPACIKKRSMQAEGRWGSVFFFYWFYSPFSLNPCCRWGAQLSTFCMHFHQEWTGETSENMMKTSLSEAMFACAWDDDMDEESMGLFDCN